jgi:hypothetical protein
MSTSEFSVKCHSCNRQVYGWTQAIKYVLSPTAANQAIQIIHLSCGCVVDFPQWKIDLNSGKCKIEDFYGRLFIEFMDEEMLLEDE